MDYFLCKLGLFDKAFSAGEVPSVKMNLIQENE